MQSFAFDFIHFVFCGSNLAGIGWHFPLFPTLLHHSLLESWCDGGSFAGGQAENGGLSVWVTSSPPQIAMSVLFIWKTSCESSLEMCFALIFLPYLQCSIRVAAAGGWLIVDLSGDRHLMGTVAGPEVCLYSRSHFLCSCDILTTLEVSQLFQGINNGSGSPYLTFTVQAACFVVVVFYLPSYLGKASDTFLLSWLHRSPFSAGCHARGKSQPLTLCQSEHSLHLLRSWMRWRLASSQQWSGNSRMLSQQCLCILHLRVICWDVTSHLFLVCFPLAQWLLHRGDLGWFLLFQWRINRSGLSKYQSAVRFPVSLTPQKGCTLKKSWPGMEGFKVLIVLVLHQAKLGGKCTYAEIFWQSLLSPKCFMPGI